MKENSKSIKGKRVALYARVSSDKQAQEGTLDSQVSLVRERIEADGGRVDPDLRFLDDGVSGTTLVRPALERLRDQAAAGAIDCLYVSAPDRLARRSVYQMVLMEEFQACGVEVVFVNRPLGATPEDQLLLQVQGIIAEYERAKILERTRRGRMHAARRGQVSALTAAPFGYRYVDKHSGDGVAAYEVMEEEAERVRQMFRWVGLEGCSLSDVGRRLEKHGVRTPKGSGPWRGSTIARILKNPAYHGQAAFGKTRRGERRPRLRPPRGHPEVPKDPHSNYRQPASEHVSIAVPALVDVELFAAVQERLQENRRRLRVSRRGPGYLLQGLVQCSCCGYALCGSTPGGKKRYAYYRCMGTDAARCGGQRVCYNPLYPCDDLDAAVWQDVCQLLHEPERLRQEFERRQKNPHTDRAASESDRLRRVIAKTKQAMSRLIDVYTDGLMETAQFEPRMLRLKDRLAQFDADFKKLQERARQDQELRLVFSQFDDFADQIRNGLTTATWEQKRQIITALVKRVEVDKSRVHIVYKVPARPFVNGPQRGILQDCPRLLPARESVHFFCARPRTTDVGAREMPGSVATAGQGCKEGEFAKEMDYRTRRVPSQISQFARSGGFWAYLSRCNPGSAHYPLGTSAWINE
jgi:site-specific DNA recombinase